MKLTATLVLLALALLPIPASTWNIPGHMLSAVIAFESWAKESFEIATKIAYRNGGRIGSPKGASLDCTMVAAAPVLPAGYVISASRIADRRMILAGYRLADLLMR